NRAEYGRSISWLVNQVEKLGVEVCLRIEATVESVLAANPDSVVVATGATPRPPTFPVDASARTATCDDVLLQRSPIAAADRCVVMDEDAHMRGPGAAEPLLNAGADVEIVTRELLVGLDVDPTLKPSLYRRLSEKGAKMTTLTGVVEVTADGVLVEHI